MVDTSRPSVIDVTRNNPKKILYIIGNENTDGSIRFVFTEGDKFAHIESRADGVFNDSGIRVSSRSIAIGRDLTISAAASFIETFNPSVADEHQRALVPHITFDVTGTEFPHTPVLKPEDTQVIFGPAVSQITSTTIGINFNSTHARLLETIFHEVGTVGATSTVEYSIYVGTDNSGLLVSRINLAASQVVANTTLEIPFNFGMGLRNNSPYFIELISSVAFSLKTDSGGNPLLAFLEQELGTLDLVTENLVYDNDLNSVLDNSLNPVYLNQFPHSDLITATP